MENHGGEKQETRLASFVVERLLEWFRSEVTNIWDRRSSFGYEQFSTFGHSCSTDVTLNCSRVLFPESPAFRLKSLPPTQLLSAEAKRSWYLLISISNPSEILHTHTHKIIAPKILCAVCSPHDRVIFCKHKVDGITPLDKLFNIFPLN